MRSQPLGHGSAADSHGRRACRGADRRTRTDSDSFAYGRDGGGEPSGHGPGGPNTTAPAGDYGDSKGIGAHAKSGADSDPDAGSVHALANSRANSSAHTHGDAGTDRDAGTDNRAGRAAGL